MPAYQGTYFAAETVPGTNPWEGAFVLRRALDPVRHPGNQGLFRALELSVLSTLVGLPLHVHAEGLRGTGKTTIIRSLKSRLPWIERIKGCVYNCRPWRPHCPQHRSLGPDEVKAIGTEWIPMPFREISHSAKIGTVAGSIDLARIADPTRPEASILPGTVAQAHRGIIFVDEVNRLADTAPELADILLDVMGTKPGRLQIEETGLPTVDLEASVSVWAASNPDEDPGPLEDIRKQLSDRFDFVITMERPSAVSAVRQILRASRERLNLLATGLSPEKEPAAAGGRPAGCAEAPAEGSGPGSARSADDWWELGRAVAGVEVPDEVEELVASLYVDFGLESLRGIEAIVHGARMNCCLEGRHEVTVADVVAVAPGALYHRLDVSTFARLMDYLAEKAKSSADETGSARSESAPAAGSGDAASGAGGPGDEPDMAADPGPSGKPERVDAPATRAASPATGVAQAQEGPGSGRWCLLKSLFGSGRSEDRGGQRARTGSDGSPTGSPAPTETTAGKDAPGGGSGGPGSAGRGAEEPARAGAGDTPAAPPNRARPLAEILQEMNAGGLTGPGTPRPH